MRHNTWLKLFAVMATVAAGNAQAITILDFEGEGAPAGWTQQMKPIGNEDNATRGLWQQNVVPQTASACNEIPDIGYSGKKALYTWSGNGDGCHYHDVDGTSTITSDSGLIKSSPTPTVVNFAYFFGKNNNWHANGLRVWYSTDGNDPTTPWPGFESLYTGDVGTKAQWQNSQTLTVPANSDLRMRFQVIGGDGLPSNEIGGVDYIVIDTDLDNDGVSDARECSANTSKVEVAVGSNTVTAQGNGLDTQKAIAYPLKARTAKQTISSATEFRAQITRGAGQTGGGSSNTTATADVFLDEYGNVDNASCAVSFNLGSFNGGLELKEGSSTLLKFSYDDWRDRVEFKPAYYFDMGIDTTTDYGLFDSDYNSLTILHSPGWKPWENNEGAPELIIDQSGIKLMLNTRDGRRLNMLEYMGDITYDKSYKLICPTAGTTLNKTYSIAPVAPANFDGVVNELSDPANQIKDLTFGSTVRACPESTAGNDSVINDVNNDTDGDGFANVDEKLLTTNPLNKDEKPDADAVETTSYTINSFMVSKTYGGNNFHATAGSLFKQWLPEAENKNLVYKVESTSNIGTNHQFKLFVNGVEKGIVAHDSGTNDYKITIQDNASLVLGENHAYVRLYNKGTGKPTNLSKALKFYIGPPAPVGEFSQDGSALNIESVPGATINIEGASCEQNICQIAQGASSSVPADAKSGKTKLIFKPAAYKGETVTLKTTVNSSESSATTVTAPTLPYIENITTAQSTTKQSGDVIAAEDVADVSAANTAVTIASQNTQPGDTLNCSSYKSSGQSSCTVSNNQVTIADAQTVILHYERDGVKGPAFVIKGDWQPMSPAATITSHASATAGQTTISGEAPKGSNVVVKDKDGTQICTTTAADDNTYSCDVATEKAEQAKATVTAPNGKTATIQLPQAAGISQANQDGVVIDLPASAKIDDTVEVEYVVDGETSPVTTATVTLTKTASGWTSDTPALIADVASGQTQAVLKTATVKDHTEVKATSKNASGTAPSSSQLLDKTPPTAATVDSANAAGVKVSLPTDADSVEVTYFDKGNPTQTKTITFTKEGGSWKVPAAPAGITIENGVASIPATGIADKDVSATSKDAAGNAATPSTKVMDTTPPSAATVDSANAEGVKVSLPADAKNGDQVKVSYVVEGSDPAETKIVTLTKQTDDSWTSDKPELIASVANGETTASLPADQVKDGSTVTAQSVDAAGNQAATDGSKVMDKTAPSAATVESANAAGVKVTLPTDAKNGDQVKVSYEDKDGTKTVTLTYNGSQWTSSETAVSVTGNTASIAKDIVSNGATVTATSVDAAGNKATASTKVMDTTPPSAATVESANAEGVKVSLPADAKNGDQVKVSYVVEGSDPAETKIVTLTKQTDDSWTSDTPDIIANVAHGETTASLPADHVKDGSTVTAQSVDAAGNQAATDGSKVMDKTLPTAATVDSANAAGVKVTLPDNADSVEVTYFDKGNPTTEKTITFTKEGGNWKAPAAPTGITIENGVASIPATGIADKDVSATSKDAAGNKATPSVKPMDTTAPSAATVESANAAGVKVSLPTDAKNGDQVEVSYQDTAGTKTVTLTYNGSQWTSPETAVSVTGNTAAIAKDIVSNGATVTATSLDAAGNKATASSKVMDNVAPAKAAISAADGKVTITMPSNPSNDDKVTVTYTPKGASEAVDVVLSFKDGKWTGASAPLTLSSDGNTVTIAADALQPETQVQTISADAAGNTETDLYATSKKPQVTEITAAGKIIGTAPADTEVVIKDKDGKVIAKVKADQNGKFAATPSRALKAGEPITVSNPTGSSSETVPNHQLAAAEVKQANGKGVAITLPANAIADDTVEVVYTDSNNQPQTVTLSKNDQGKWTAPSNSKVAISADGTTASISAAEVADAKQVSATSKNKVVTKPASSKEMDKTAPKAATVTYSEDAGVAIALPTDAKAGDKVKVAYTPKGGTEQQVELTFKDGKWTGASAPLNLNGNQATIASDQLKPDSKVTTSSVDAAGNTGAPASHDIDSHDNNDNNNSPTISQKPHDVKVLADGKIIGKAPAGTDVVIKDKAGKVIATVKADHNGKFKATPSQVLSAGEKINVSNPAGAVEKTVPAQPTVAVADDGKTITGKVPAENKTDAKVVIQDQDGKEIAKGEVSADGTQMIVKDKAGKVIATGAVQADGTFAINADKLPAGSKVTIQVVDGDGDLLGEANSEMGGQDDLSKLIADGNTKKATETLFENADAADQAALTDALNKAQKATSDAQRQAAKKALETALAAFKDSDGDGVSDKVERANGTEAQVGDTDGDGILDSLECPYAKGCNKAKDTNGKFVLDGNDQDHDGIIDVLDAYDSSGKVETSVNGVGSFGLGSLLLLAVALLLGKLRQARAVVLGLALVFSQLASANNDASLADDDPFYFGGGVGVSKLQPKPESGNLYRVDKDTATAYKLFAGYNLNRAWALELYYADLGKAELDASADPGLVNQYGERGELLYKVIGINARYYPLHKMLADSPANWFVQVGAANIQNDNPASVAGKKGVPFERKNSVSFAYGIGGEYEFAHGIAVQAVLETFDNDAAMASIGIRYRPHFGKRAPAPQVMAPATMPEVIPEPVAQVVEAAQPVEAQEVKAQVVESMTVVDALENWRSAWAGQNVPAYIASYVAQFNAGHNAKASHAAWRQFRTARIQRPQWINVVLTDVDVIPQTKTKTTAIFTQKYSSNLFKSTIIKQLDFALVNGQWQIDNEFILPRH